ncbi:MAG: hypothetical protein OXE92_09510 [Bacteroidetes bacterium]|nr:hypothetical protein [Bacteroidota bacterium]
MDVPSKSTFSRASQGVAQMQLLNRIQEALIEEGYEEDRGTCLPGFNSD